MPETRQRIPCDASSGLGRIEVAGRWSLIAIVAAGVLITLPNLAGPWYAPARLALVALGLVYLLSYTYVGEWAERSAGRLAPTGYVVLQLALAALMFAIAASQGTFGMTWFVLMPLVGHAVFLFGAVGVVLTSLAAVALVTGHAAQVAGARVLYEVAPGVALAVLFVVLFANVARMELAARTRSEGLREQLEEAHARLAAYSVQAAELATSRERNRMAREIHDSVGHHLTVVSVQLEAAELVLDRDPEDARRRIARAKELTREGLAEVRRSVGSLRASPLDGRSLPEAVGEMVAGAEEPAVELAVTGEPRELSDAVALTLYRAAQEGLTNARRHSRAHRIGVDLDFSAAESVRLSVRDDGDGADLSSADGPGFGLLGLRERVQLVGGRMTVDSEPGAGFTLTVEVPA